MTNPADPTRKMLYNLYTNASHTIVFGDGTGGTGTVTGTLSWFGNPVAVSVYGLIPALQNVSAGFFADQVTVTIDF